jgi:hypothetical protein
MSHSPFELCPHPAVDIRWILRPNNCFSPPKLCFAKQTFLSADQQCTVAIHMRFANGALLVHWDQNKVVAIAAKHTPL